MIKQEQKNKNLCRISRQTFKSIYLLAVIGSYKNGVYGLKRLQKVTYLSELESPLKPYSFKRHHYGQYSEELAEINNQLIELNFISPKLLDDSRCCVFSLSPHIDVSYYKDILAKIDPLIIERIREAIDEFGYLPEEKLIEWCYSLPEFKDKSSGEIVINADMPDSIEIPGFDPEICENLELTFSKSFINSISTIIDGLDNSAIDIEKVKQFVVKL
jgi:hypothetical protein